MHNDSPFADLFLPAFHSCSTPVTGSSRDIALASARPLVETAQGLFVGCNVLHNSFFSGAMLVDYLAPTACDCTVLSCIFCPFCCSAYTATLPALALLLPVQHCAPARNRRKPRRVMQGQPRTVDLQPTGPKRRTLWQAKRHPRMHLSPEGFRRNKSACMILGREGILCN